MRNNETNFILGLPEITIFDEKGKHIDKLSLASKLNIDEEKGIIHVELEGLTDKIIDFMSQKEDNIKTDFDKYINKNKKKIKSINGTRCKLIIENNVYRAEGNVKNKMDIVIDNSEVLKWKLNTQTADNATTIKILFSFKPDELTYNFY